MKTYFLVILFSIITLCSCTVMGSLHPLSQDDNQLIFKKELLGNWINTKNTNERYLIDTTGFSKGKYYTIVVLTSPHNANAGDTIHLVSTLVEINNQYFLDCRLDEEKMISHKKDVEDLIVLKHIILKLSFNGKDTVEAMVPDPDELIKLIDAGKIRLQYTEIAKDNYLILDNTKELQKAAVALMKYPEVYKTVVQFIRSK